MLPYETAYLFISENEQIDKYLKRITRRHFVRGVLYYYCRCIGGGVRKRNPQPIFRLKSNISNNLCTLYTTLL